MITVLTTLYKSEAYVAEFYRRSVAAAEQTGEEFRFVFVDDGSPDNSAARVLEISRQDGRVALIRLSRNFGHHRAILAGLQYCAESELTFLIDCDLEEPPELLTLFYREMKLRNADVVYGYQSERKRSLLSNFVSAMFYRLFNLISGVKIPRNLVMARLMNKSFVSALNQYEEMHPMLAGIWSDAGFEQVGIEVDKAYKGSTTYSLARKLSQTVDAVTGFSAKPLYYLFYLGTAIAAVSAAIAAWFIAMKLSGRIEADGWTSLMVSIWLLGGSIIASIGVVGAYIGRIFIEVKGRPRTIIARIHGWASSDG